MSAEDKRDYELQPGVVLIFVQFKSTFGPWSVTVGSWGSGFLYRPDGYLITNMHVAQLANEMDPKADRGRIQIAAPMLTRAVLESEEKKLNRQLTDDEKEKVTTELIRTLNTGGMQITDVSLTVHLSNGASYAAEIKAASHPIDEGGKDIAIIKINGDDLPTVDIGNSDDVWLGESLTIVGYPVEQPIIDGDGKLVSSSVSNFTYGRISGINNTDYKETTVLQSTAVINHGSRGGPAFDEMGRVAGVLTAEIDRGPSRTSLFIPINTAIELAHRIGAEPQRGRFDELWRNALDAYWEAQSSGFGWIRAHELLGKVLRMMPNQPDARHLEREAGEHIPKNPITWLIDRFGWSTFLVSGAGGLFVLSFLSILFLFRPVWASNRGEAIFTHENAEHF
jgi:serine protease Do